MIQKFKKSFKQHLYIAVVGGVILSLWGAFSWRVLPWHQGNVKSFTDEQVVMSALEENAPESGLYLMPYCKQDRVEGSLLMFGFVQPQWHKRSEGLAQFINFLMHAIAVYIVAWMFVHVKPLTYWEKVGFTTIVGLFAAAVIVLPYWNFLEYPFRFVVVSVLDITIGWFLAGLAIAKIHSQKK